MPIWWWSATVYAGGSGGEVVVMSDQCGGTGYRRRWWMATILFREDATVDDLIDVIEGNRKYMKCIYVYNNLDIDGGGGFRWTI
ncbi:hypothetical protein RJ639_019393 [Escallonia herrerae]|uniref:GTP binding protein second domain-containing protein n=1 Tax=Escallonia herrerae TaxID=1293975 RepID=A0AA88V8R5_9ASTE|nr:hypothetical protein RJ639_019393 [Escallonia herrerae]